ncbi:MAG: ATPase P [Sphingobacteriales bacterium]|nr:ATPase P [Sphingobacteriales bacterium]
MIKITIPGHQKEELCLQHLILDFNGTLAIEGKLISGVTEKLLSLSKKITIHVLTGNTYGTAAEELKDLPCKLISVGERNQQAEKENYLNTIDHETVISIGNGRNDKLMLLKSAIGIVVMQAEGMSVDAFMAADIVCHNIFDALDLLENPNRIKSTLRN